MKILGKTDHGYIVQMSEAETRAIIGDNRKTLVPGTDVAVYEAWKDLSRFRDAHDEIMAAADSLRACALLAERTAAEYVVNPEEKPEVTTDHV